MTDPTNPKQNPTNKPPADRQPALDIEAIKDLRVDALATPTRSAAARARGADPSDQPMTDPAGDRPACEPPRRLSLLASGAPGGTGNRVSGRPAGDGRLDRHQIGGGDPPDERKHQNKDSKH